MSAKYAYELRKLFLLRLRFSVNLLKNLISFTWPHFKELSDLFNHLATHLINRACFLNGSSLPWFYSISGAKQVGFRMLPNPTPNTVCDIAYNMYIADDHPAIMAMLTNCNVIATTLDHKTYEARSYTGYVLHIPPNKFSLSLKMITAHLNASENTNTPPTSRQKNLFLSSLNNSQ